MHRPTVVRLSEHLGARAGEYFPDLADGRVKARLVETRERPCSTLYRFALEDGRNRHDVMTKVTHGRRRLRAAAQAPTAAQDRPRLVPATSQEVKHDYEYSALLKAQSHFQALGDPRLAVVRPLDHLPDLHALTIEFVEEPTLRDLLVRRAGRRALISPTDAELVFANAGAWLREFHAIRSREAAALRTNATEVAATLQELSTFLARAGADDDGLFRAIGCAAANRVPLLFAAGLPVALGHGDFAPRNVFVGTGGTVTGFDVLGRFRVPIFEDLAHFRIALRTAGAQTIPLLRSLPPERLLKCERALVRGYFGDAAVPEAELAVFDLLVLLEKWASVLVTGRSLGARRRLLWTAYRLVAAGDYRRHARRLLHSVEAA